MIETSEGDSARRGDLPQGDFEALVSAAYHELRRMAAGLLQGRGQSRTLQPTALVHEAYLRLRQNEEGWENRAHFFGAAARAMRQVLVEYARRRNASKRGGDGIRVTFEDLAVMAPEPKTDVVALDDALSALESVGARFTRIVELRYFAGCTVDEIAELTGASPASVKRDFTYSRAWLHDYLRGENPGRKNAARAVAAADDRT